MPRQTPLWALALPFLAMATASLFMAAKSTGRFAFRSKEQEKRFWVERLKAEAPDPAQVTLSHVYSLKPNAELMECFSSENPAIFRTAREILWNIWWQSMGAELSSRADEARLLMDDERYLPYALERVDRLLKNRPDTAEILSLRGRILMKVGRYDDGLADLRRALRLNPLHWPSMREVHGWARFYGDRDTALSAARDLLALFPHDPDAKRRVERLDAPGMGGADPDNRPLSWRTRDVSTTTTL